MKLFLYVVLFLSSTTLFAQHTISGTITDAKTNTPIADVNIYIKANNKGTTTAADGTYSIPNLKPGNYDIFFSVLGYQEIHKKIQVTTNTVLNLQLQPTALELEGVLISAPFHKLQKDNVMKVEKVKTENLSKANTITEQLSQVPGINQISTGSGIGKPVIRGLSSNRVLVYIQGVRLENQQFGEEHGIGVSAAGVESVEIIKGPASLLYGSDAIGGVLFLNPELYAPIDSLQTDISAQYFSNTNGINTNLGVKSSTDNFKFLTRFAMQQHADYKYKNTRVTNTRFSEYDLKAGIGFGSDNITNDIRYNLNFSRIGIPEEIGIQNNHIKPLLPNQSIENHVLSANTKAKLNYGKLDMTVGYTHNQRKEYEDAHEHHDEEEEEEHEEEHEEHNDDPTLEMHLSTLNYNFKYELPEVNNFEIIIGTQGMFQKNKNFGEEILIPDANTTDFGVFSTTHYHWKNQALQFGFRYDYRKIQLLREKANKQYNSFNGALGYKIDITPKITGRINLASGFRAPNLAELTSDGEHEGSNRYEIGNINLKEEQNMQLDLNLNYKSEHFEFFVNGFYNNINNYIYISPTEMFIDNAKVFLYLQENAYLYGGELGFHLHPHPLDWLHITSSFETVTGKLSAGDYLPLIPANSIHTNLDLTIANTKKNITKAFVGVKNVFKQHKTNPFETNTNAYNLVNLGVNTSIKTSKANFQVNLGINNVFDKEYINHLSRLKTDGIYNQGRNIIVGATISL